MKYDDHSVLTGDGSLQLKDLNETLISHLTKESGEKEYKELTSLINDFRENKANVSYFSNKNIDKSNSILSNGDIWNENKSQDDSKQFIENFYTINKKKRKSHYSELKKPNLTINVNLIKSDENYNDDIDENINVDKEILVQKNTFETNNNNLNEVYITNKPKSDKDLSSQSFIKIEEDHKLSNQIKNISTRQSTESNESVPEQKYFTPTHQNTLKNYNIFPIQREIDFCSNKNMLSSKFNMGYTNPYIATGFYNTPYTTKAMSFCANNKTPPVYKYTEKKTTFESKPVEKEILDHKIVLENIIIQKDKRTTLMLRNIPNKYTLQNLVDEIVNNNPSFAGKFDYINLPIDYERKLNLGYAFINFNDSLHIVLFYECFYGKKWQKYKSDKKIELNYAEKQGKKEVNNRDENTYFASEDKKLIQKKIIPRLDLPIRFLETFKKLNPNSVCIQSDNIFYVKSLGKKI